MEFSCELIIYAILIVLPLYGLYRNSVETNNKKYLLINKLENLNGDLSFIKSSLDKENNKVLEKLEQMKKKLETQRTILSENAVLQVSQNDKNKVLLSDLNEFIENQKQDLRQEKNKFEAFVSSLKTP